MDLHERRARLIAELHELDAKIDLAEGLQAVDRLSPPNTEWSAVIFEDVLCRPLPSCEPVHE